MTMLPISIHQASVKTFTASVKTIQINQRQLTLAVFRQLQPEDLIDPETGELTGVPWGRVNYFWGDCKPDHLHVVWQKGEELRRACVAPKPYQIPHGSTGYASGYERVVERRDTFGELLFVAHHHVHPADMSLLYSYNSPGSVEFSDGCRIGGVGEGDWDKYKTFHGYLCGEAGYQANADRADRYRERIMERRAELLADLGIYLPADTDDRAWHGEMWALYKQVAGRVSDFVATWAASYAEVEATDQLFIAM